MLQLLDILRFMGRISWGSLFSPALVLRGNLMAPHTVILSIMRSKTAL